MTPQILTLFAKCSASLFVFFIKVFLEVNENNNESYCRIERKINYDRNITKQQKDSILTFCHSDNSSSVDINYKWIVEVKNGLCERHVGRV